MTLEKMWSLIVAAEANTNGLPHLEF